MFKEERAQAIARLRERFAADAMTYLQDYLVPRERVRVSITITTDTSEWRLRPRRAVLGVATPEELITLATILRNLKHRGMITKMAAAPNQELSGSEIVKMGITSNPADTLNVCFRNYGFTDFAFRSTRPRRHGQKERWSDLIWHVKKLQPRGPA